MVSTPATSSAPDGPTQSSPLRSGGQFRTWFTNITEWIRGLSPAGLPYTTNWIAAENVSRVVAFEPTWDVGVFLCSREGRNIDMQMRLTYTGPEIRVPADGDVVNVAMGTVVADFRPRYMAALSTADSGPVSSVSVDNQGAMRLSATAPGAIIKAGTIFSFQGMWRMASTDAN